MTDEMRLADTDGIQKLDDKCPKCRNSRPRQPDRGLTMTWQIERNYRRLLCECVDVEQPVVDIAAKAVNQDDWHPVRGPAPGVAYPQAVDINEIEFRGGALVLLLGLWRDPGRNVAVDVGIADVCFRHYPEERLDRQYLALRCNLSSQSPRIRRLNLVRDLVRLNFKNRHADGDLRSFLHQPCDQGALPH